MTTNVKNEFFIFGVMNLPMVNWCESIEIKFNPLYKYNNNNRRCNFQLCKVNFTYLNVNFCLYSSFLIIFSPKLLIILLWFCWGVNFVYMYGIATLAINHSNKFTSHAIPLYWFVVSWFIPIIAVKFFNIYAPILNG